MGFIENIVSSIGGVAEPAYKAVIYGDYAAYIQGVKSIKSYTAERIEISLKKGGVVITGKDMFVKKYCLGDLVICGNVSSLSKI